MTARWQLSNGEGSADEPAQASGDRRGGTISLIDGCGGDIRAGGVDLTDVGRLQLAVQRSGEGLVRRMFDDEERDWAAADSQQRLSRLSAMFSIKESVVKAVGGFPRGSSYADISVGETAAWSASPVKLRGELGRWAEASEVELMAGALPLFDGLVLGWVLARGRGGLR